MSTGSFTAGPWAISGVLEGRGDITISSGRLVVATAHNGVSFFDVINSRDPEQQWANARLIAAAPELLEALIRCVAEVRLEAKQIEYAARNFGGYDDGPEPPHEYTRLMGVANLAESAIAKARGDA